MQQPTLRVGGVPEHFNYPWQLAQEQQLSDSYPFSFEWKNFPGGTGAMLQALEADELDVAVLLTEGGVSAIAQGLEAQIIGTYVASPLHWGIHVPAQSDIQSVADTQNRIYAISRPRSGSHLMTYVHYKNQDWPTSAIRFEEVQDFAGAKKAFAEGEAEVFLWEKYTTKPTVDSGAWRRVGICPTPWPSFILIAKKELCETQPDNLKKLLRLARHARHLFNEADTLQYIAEKYGLQLSDTREWFQQTRWLSEPRIARTTLQETQATLYELGILPEIQAAEALIADFCRLVEPHISAVMYDWRVENVYRKLTAMGKSVGALELQDLLSLGHLDQYHYLGEKTSYELVELLQLSREDQVLDIGSGVGGTSRVLAAASGCQVTGVELQDGLNELAEELTFRVGLAEQVDFVTKDFIDWQPPYSFDVFISLLVFLHLPDRAAALAKAYDCLKPGGRFAIEDLICLQPEGQQDERLSKVVSAHLTDRAHYQADLQAAGFVEVEWKDQTAAWKDWTALRYENFIAEEAENRRLYGEAAYEQRAYFYKTIRDLFQEGLLGGLRLVGKR